MKRMTSNEYNPCFNCNFYSSCSHIRENFPVCPERARYDRLAAIEDILGDEYDLDRLRELAQADREGRCVVLPCDIGDTVYSIRKDFYNRALRTGLQTGKVRGFEFNSAQPVMWVHLEYDTPTAKIAFRLNEIGETVFLTRAEAQAALRREQDG